MNDHLIPVKFTPILKDKIWGGNHLATLLGKSPLPQCGESWELSGVPGNVSVVAGGALNGKRLTDLLHSNGSGWLGDKVHAQHGTQFPLLIKFIDANDDLSVQVHPGDALAAQRHQSLGKTEMWVVLHAEPGARLISGFSRPITPEAYFPSLQDGTFMDALGQYEVHAGDVFFMPAGRIHAIGKGIVVAEIQQSSDVTYRVFDYNRTDSQGNQRELHVQEALDAIDFNDCQSGKVEYRLPDDGEATLVQCAYFHTNLLRLKQKKERNFESIDSFKLYICTLGSGTVYTSTGNVSVRLGETILIPAAIQTLQIEPAEKGIQLLEVYVP